eukprot:6630919-Prymnesium_polylepis.1
MNGLGGGEMLLRTPEQYGRGRGLVNGELRDAAMPAVAKLLEPACDVGVSWARAVADEVKAGDATAILPPRPPQPP